MNIYGQVGWRSSSTQTLSTLWNNIHAVWNADNTPNDSVGTNHGTLTNGTTYTTGKIGQAFSFDGVNDYITLPNNMMSAQTFSYSAWVRYNNIPTGESYVFTATNGNGTNTNYGTAFGMINGQLALSMSNNNSGTAWRMSSGVLLANIWYHIAVTKVSSLAPKFYLNGVLQGTTLIIGTNNATLSYGGGSFPNSLCSIGACRYNNGSNTYAYTNGIIDALSVWNKELNQSEITEAYNSGNGKQYPN